MLKAFGDDGLVDVASPVEVLSARLLAQRPAGLFAQVSVHALEEVLEQERQQAPRQLQPLVAVVVPATADRPALLARTRAAPGVQW